MNQIERIKPPESDDSLTRARLAFAIDLLEKRGSLTGRRSRKLSVRVDPGLIEAAREKLGHGSDSEVVTAALAVLVGTDDFGLWLISQKGTLPEDFEIGF